jgi:type III secretion protein C
MEPWRMTDRTHSPLRRDKSSHLAQLARWVLVFCLMAPATQAQDIPWRKPMSFDLQAVNEPLNVFLTRLFTLHGLPATMSPAVASGRVNGRFRGRIESVFKEISDTYGLTWYYDGTTLHVYSLAEMETRLLQVEPNDTPRIDRILRQMRLNDPRFPLRLANNEGHILISGPPRYVELVTDVVQSVADSPTMTKGALEVRVFRLKYARAADTTVAIGGVDTVIPGLAAVLNEVVGAIKPTAAPQSRSQARTVRGLRGKGQRAIGRGAEGATPEAGNSAAEAAPLINPSASDIAAAGFDNRRTGLLGAGNTAAPEPPAAREREAAVRAEPRLNAVIVRDSPDRMAMYARLIETLDVDTPLMEIEASVIDVSDDKSEQLGIDWRGSTRRLDVASSPNTLAGDGSGQRNAANDLLFSQNPLSVGKGLIGTLLLGNERNFFIARINALAENGDAKLISRPRVLTIDNTEAVLQSTREFYVRVAGRDQVDLFNVSLGLTMRVTPTLVEDANGKRFKLIIRIEDGTTNSGATVDQIPVVSRNAISTQAMVGDGQSLLIGGYTIEERREGRSGVPVLSDMPLIGRLFGQRSKELKRVERMFLITPRLVSLGNLAEAAAAAARTSAPNGPAREASSPTP